MEEYEKLKRINIGEPRASKRCMRGSGEGC